MTPADLEMARAWRAAGETQLAIAMKLGISQSGVSRYLSGRLVAQEPVEDLTEEARRLRSEGKLQREIAAELGLSQSVVCGMVVGQEMPKPPDGLKQCSMCEQLLDVVLFKKNSGSYDGLNPSCDSCHRVSRNRPERKAKREVWKQSPEGRASIKKHNRSRKAFAAYLARAYGLSFSDFSSLVVEQLGLCAGCLVELVPEGRNRFHVDHDHATGKVRGLLCASCNSALGLAHDSPTVLRQLAAYLRETS